MFGYPIIHTVMDFNSASFDLELSTTPLPIKQQKLLEFQNQLAESKRQYNQGGLTEETKNGLKMAMAVRNHYIDAISKDIGESGGGSMTIPLMIGGGVVLAFLMMRK